MSEVEELKDLLRRTSEVLHQITEDTDGIWVFLKVHGMEYSGAQYGEILKEIDGVLGLEREDG